MKLSESSVYYDFNHGEIHKIYMTRIHQRFEGDTYFPELKMEEWKQVSRNDFQADEKNNYS